MRMNWIENHRKKLLKVIIIVLIILDMIWSIGNEQEFFYWDGAYNSNSVVFYWTMKVIYTFFILLLGLFAYRFLVRPVYYLPMIKEWLKYAWPVVAVYIVLMFMLWPGNWGAVGDEIQVYLSVKNLRVWPDQGIMSSVFMILCLMIYPSLWMITFVQGILSMILIGNVLKDINHELVCGRLARCLLTLLFISPPALCFVLCPIRVWLYSVFLVALLEHIYLLNKCGEKSKQKRILCSVTILCALVANYRSEGMLFIIVCLLSVVLHGNLHISKVKVVLLQLAFICVVTMTLRGLTLLGNGMTLRQHSGLSFITTLSMVLSDDEKYNQIDPADIENIDAVFDVEVLREHPSMSAAFDGTRAERTFAEPTEEQMSAYMMSSMKIILKNIPTFVACKWEAAKWSMGVYPYYRTVGTVWTQEILDSWNENTDLPGNMSDDFRKYADNNVRRRVSDLIVVAFTWHSINSFYIFYAFWLPCLLLPTMVVFNLVRKNWFEAFMCLSFSIQLIMVIVMAPGRYQMYYLPFYFVGWIETVRSVSMAFQRNNNIKRVLIQK